MIAEVVLCGGGALMLAEVVWNLWQGAHACLGSACVFVPLPVIDCRWLGFQVVVSAVSLLLRQAGLGVLVSTAVVCGVCDISFYPGCRVGPVVCTHVLSVAGGWWVWPWQLGLGQVDVLTTGEGPSGEGLVGESECVCSMHGRLPRWPLSVEHAVLHVWQLGLQLLFGTAAVAIAWHALLRVCQEELQTHVA